MYIFHFDWRHQHDGVFFTLIFDGREGGGELIHPLLGKIFSNICKNHFSVKIFRSVVTWYFTVRKNEFGQPGLDRGDNISGHVVSH